MSTLGWQAQQSMMDDSVGTAEIIDLNVTNAKIANATITASKLASGAGAAGYYGITNYGTCYYG